MEKICVDLKENSYSIIIEKSFSNLRNFIPIEEKDKRKFIIITDENVSKYHLQGFLKELNHPAERTFSYAVSPGENSKCLETADKIYDFLLNINTERTDVIFALGGGVIGDIAGFVASTYCRGLSFIQVPTTLLAQIDSGIGGKTGVNHRGVKNLIGSFYQPKLVYINTNVLNTLPENEIRNGLAEAVVHGIIADHNIVDYILNNVYNILEVKNNILIPLIYNNCKVKASVVQQDEKDTGIRKILNFGHTFGHAIESIYEYKYSHGECVSMGTVAAFKTSVYLNLISIDKLHYIKNILDMIGLPTKLKGLDWKKITERMKYDKKTEEYVTTFILPLEIGKVTCRQLEIDSDLIAFISND